MSVVMSEQQWTICLGCGQNVTTGMCVCVGDSEFVVVVPASVLDEARARLDCAYDALGEIEVILRGGGKDRSKLDGIGAIVSNGPLDTAPGGPREDECERLRSRVRELEDALRKIAESPWTSVRESERGLAVLAQRPVPFQEDDPKLYSSSSSESPVDALARVGQDVQPDGYANHVGASGARGEGPHNSDATHTTCPDCKGGGPFFPLGCASCSGSGRVPTTNDPTGGNDAR